MSQEHSYSILATKKGYTLLQNNEVVTPSFETAPQIRKELVRQMTESSALVTFPERKQQQTFSYTFKYLDNKKNLPRVLVQDPEGLYVAHLHAYDNGDDLYISWKGYGGSSRENADELQSTYGGSGIITTIVSVLGEYAIDNGYTSISGQIDRSNLQALRSRELATSIIGDYEFDTKKTDTGKNVHYVRTYLIPKRT